MDPLIADGLRLSAVGLTLVFAVLALLWGMLALLTRIFPESPLRHPRVGAGRSAEVEAQRAAAAALTAERAQVAAVAAAALMANALPMLMEPPAGEEFEHGRIAPSWVSANRARALRSWQPPRQRMNND
jgi:Na+-transporting methylmalonyl-CoA/oxaloacetate decarboxylase gamma subunit